LASPNKDQVVTPNQIDMIEMNDITVNVNSRDSPIKEKQFYTEDSVQLPS